MVYAIGLGSNPDRAVLQQMADLSGGRAFFPADVDGPARRVPARHRRPAPPLRHRLHVHAHRARRQLAQGRDPGQERAGRDGPDERRVRRAVEVGSDANIGRRRPRWAHDGGTAGDAGPLRRLDGGRAARQPGVARERPAVGVLAGSTTSSDSSRSHGVTVRHARPSRTVTPSARQSHGPFECHDPPQFRPAAGVGRPDRAGRGPRRADDPERHRRPGAARRRPDPADNRAHHWRLGRGHTRPPADDAAVRGGGRARRGVCNDRGWPHAGCSTVCGGGGQGVSQRVFFLQRWPPAGQAAGRHWRLARRTRQAIARRVSRGCIGGQPGAAISERAIGPRGDATRRPAIDLRHAISAGSGPGHYRAIERRAGRPLARLRRRLPACASAA